MLSIFLAFPGRRVAWPRTFWPCFFVVLRSRLSPQNLDRSLGLGHLFFFWVCCASLPQLIVLTAIPFPALQRFGKSARPSACHALSLPAREISGGTQFSETAPPITSFEDEIFVLVSSHSVTVGCCVREGKRETESRPTKYAVRSGDTHSIFSFVAHTNWAPMMSVAGAILLFRFLSFFFPSFPRQRFS